MDEKTQYELEIAEFEAYNRAITKQMAKVTADIKNKVASDTISEKYDYIINLHTRSLESTRKLVKEGKATEKDVLKAEENLIRTKIDYAKRRQEVSDKAGGNKINELNDRLADITVEASVNKSRYEIIRKRLNEVEAKLAAASKYESKRSKIQAAKKTMKAAEDKLRQAEKQIANLKMPIVTVIGAN